MPKRLMSASLLALLLASFAAPAAAQQPAAAPASAQPAAAQNPDSTALRKLFHDSDEDNLKRKPLFALFRGDTRYADQFGDFVSEASIAADKAALERDLAALAKIDRSKLSPQEQVSYDVFRYNQQSELGRFEPALLKIASALPLDHFNGLHAQIPDLFSGQSVVQFKTVKDYEDNLKRLDGFVYNLDGVLGWMEKGLAAGIVQPKIVSERVLGQLDRFIETGVENSTLMMPVKKFPDGVSQADRDRLTAAYTAKMRDKVMPAYVRLRDFVRDKYLPASRGNERPGLVSIPGGPAYYEYLARTSTTTEMSPAEIHELGLREVARITAGMNKVREQVGFKGDLKQFFEYMRTDPRFQPASKEALTQGYYAIGKRVDGAIPRLFSVVPKTPLEIRPVPEYLEKDQAGGYYYPGAPDGSRPGIFYFNTYDLKSRNVSGMETLYLHEGIPGHHFQIALAYENAALPSFQRFGGNTAFSEGWGLYAESLGEELGMFTDPYQKFGNLDDEMLRAMRLVVDTGLHLKGWSRQQAIDYMLAHSSMGVTDATNEVDRYIAMPGQALAYKIGQLRIRAARDRAQKALGPKFDVRKFHEQVLMSGALPMEVLDAKIDNWIAAGGQ